MHYLLIRRLEYFENRESLLMEALTIAQAIDQQGEPIGERLQVIDIGNTQALAIAPPANIASFTVWVKNCKLKAAKHCIRFESIDQGELINQVNLYAERSPSIKGNKIDLYT